MLLIAGSKKSAMIARSVVTVDERRRIGRVLPLTRSHLKCLSARQLKLLF